MVDSSAYSSSSSWHSFSGTSTPRLFSAVSLPTCATVLTRNIQCSEVETHTSVLLGSFFAADTERSIKLRSDSCFRPYMMAQLIVQDLVVLDRRREIVDLNHA